MALASLHERMLRQLTPEQGLAIEVLRQAVQDARHPLYDRPLGPGSWQWREQQAFLDARRWLTEGRAEVEEWLDLLDLPPGTYTTLLREAGLAA